MIGKDRIFKRGDVIVSGLGNIRIFTGEKFDGDSYKCLACYCVSDLPAGTDMRYARHATEKEKKLFFNALKANGLCFDKANLWITFAENVSVENLVMAKIDWKADGPQSYKVVKKRVRPTLKEVNELKSGLENERRLHIHFAKECDQLNAHLEDVRACNEKYAKEIKRLEEDNKALCDKNATLEQSNTLMDEELARQRKANIELSKFNDQYRQQITDLQSRGFWARVFNW